MKLFLTIPIFVLISDTTIVQKSKKQKTTTGISPVELSINHTDSLIKNVLKDTNLVSLTIPALGKALHNIFPDKYDTLYNTITSVWQNGQLFMLLLFKTPAQFRKLESMGIYFMNNKPVLLQEDKFSNEIMGSCGAVNASFYHYFNDTGAYAGLLQGTNKFYAFCYGWLLAKPNATTFFNQTHELRKLIATKAPDLLPINSANTNKSVLRFLFTKLLKPNEPADRYGF